MGTLNFVARARNFFRGVLFRSREVLFRSRRRFSGVLFAALYCIFVLSVFCCYLGSKNGSRINQQTRKSVSVVLLFATFVFYIDSGVNSSRFCWFVAGFENGEVQFALAGPIRNALREEIWVQGACQQSYAKFDVFTPFFIQKQLKINKIEGKQQRCSEIHDRKSDILTPCLTKNGPFFDPPGRPFSPQNGWLTIAGSHFL